MAGTPESKVKEAVRVLLKKYSAYWHSPVQNGMGRPSLDFICCLRGRYFGVETKAPGNHLTPRQELTKKEIEDAGGKVFVVGEVDHYEEEAGVLRSHRYSGMAELEAWLLDLLK